MTRPLAILCILASLLGCAHHAPTTGLEIDAAQYASAFDAAREVLIDCRFQLERVDAAAGLITTSPKPTAGLLTPAHGEQQTFSSEFDDALNAQRRIVRIEFHPLTDAREASQPLTPGVPVAPPADLRDASTRQGPPRLEARVRVVIERRQTPNRTIEPASIRRSQSFIDPALAPRQMAPSYYVAQRDDPDLARRIVAMIRERIAG